MSEHSFTIATPQFKGTKIYYWLVQSGSYDSETKLFTPTNGGHTVQFNRDDDVRKAEAKAESLIATGYPDAELYSVNHKAYLP